MPEEDVEGGNFRIGPRGTGCDFPALLVRAPGSDARLISTPVDTRYGRAAEPRLDLQAAQYLVRTGYDPRLAALFFRTVAGGGGAPGSETREPASHPSARKSRG